MLHRMTDGAGSTDVPDPTGHARMSPARAIALGTLIVGVLDGLDAVVFFGLRGVSAVRIFQGIAFSVLGRATYAHGLRSAALGVVLHFIVACGIVTVYLAISGRIRRLRRQPWLYGVLYGVAAYFVMNLVVIPLTAIGYRGFTTPALVNGLLIHVFGVGIPTALIGSRVR